MPNITATSSLYVPNSFGANLLDNPGFEALLPADQAAARPNDLCVGWYDIGTTPGISRAITDAIVNPGFVFSGTKAFYFSTDISQTFGAGVVKQTTQATSGHIFVKPGETYFCRWTGRTDRITTPPAGLTLGAGLFVRVTSILGGVTDYQIGISLAPSDSGLGWLTRFGSMVIPATLPVDGAIPAYAQIYIYCNVSNPTGSPITLGGSLIFDARFDNIELYRAVNPTSDELLKFGVIPPSFFGTMTYTNTTTSINWIWNITVMRIDNAASTVVLNSSQNVTGLTISSAYKFYPFMDEATLAVNMVTTGGTGTPAWAHVGTNRAWTVEQARADHVPLTPLPADGSTTSGGTGGGGGPPTDNGCLVLGTFVKERTKGVIACELVEAGDYLWSEGDTWIKVLSVRQAPHELWADLEFSCGQKLRNTEGHPYKMVDQSIKRAYELCLADEIPSSTGITNPVAIELLKEPLTKVVIECEEPHTFFAASLPQLPWVLTHNYATA